MSHVYIRTPTRRDVLRALVASIAAIGITRVTASFAGEELPHLTDANPAAASLDYTEDAGSVDPHKVPRHTPDQRCANCKFFQADPGAPYAPCRLYPGNAVSANGWCAGYVAR